MVQAGPPYAHGSWECKGWENHEKTILGYGLPVPIFSSRNWVSATRALHAVWGVQVYPVGVMLQTTRVSVCPLMLER